MICSSIILLIFVTIPPLTEAVLDPHYYDKTCPQAEDIVSQIVRNASTFDPKGCDASVLLDSTPENKAEKDGPPNISLRAFYVIDDAKTMLEKACPHTVSCADILAIAARDVVTLSGGPSWEVLNGRKDGRISRANETINLPAPSFNTSQLIQSFSKRGLSIKDLVALSGGHTLGFSHCSSFEARLHNFSSVHDTDPSLNVEFAESLKRKCPKPNHDKNAGQFLDSSASTFDNGYYKQILAGKGVFASDQSLYGDFRTRWIVESFASDESLLFSEFAASMVKLGNVGEKEIVMGKEWLNWVGGGGGGGGGGSGVSGVGERNRSTRRRRMVGEVKEATSGCMCAVFQLFDLHHFQFPLNQQPEYFHQEEDTTTSKGVEAPRNSLELEEPAMKAASFSLEDKKLKIPAPIQIKSRLSDSISESNTINSPGTKTPNLVARLMGLDLLPECGSPAFSSSSSLNPSKTKSHLHSRNLIQSRSRSSRISYSDDDISINGARSLPETPRISSARRSDVDHHHRLSLQINKENIGQDYEYSAVKKIATRRGIVQENDQNRSPGNYAKQIVKQVKESFNRKVGLQDITNTIKNKEQRRDENLLRKPSKVLTKIDEELVHQEKKLTPNSKNQTSLSPKLAISSLTSNQKPQVPLQHQKNFNQKRKEVASSKIKKAPQVSDSIRNKKEEAFVRSTLTSNKVNLGDKKSKKTPFSNELPNINVPTLLPVKRDPSPPATKLPQKQSQVSDSHALKRSTQLSCCSSHSYKQETIFTIQENTQQVKTKEPITSGEYRQYIQRILKRIGITDKPTPVISLYKLNSPSRPLLDPSIFNFLELFHPYTTAATTTVLSDRCNRKLIFQLVNELLAEIVRPDNCIVTWATPKLSGSELIDKLCMKIQSFPAANCQVLGDIDALIGTEFSKSQLGGSRAFFEEEGEGIVREIEREIVDSLVHETIADYSVRAVGRNKSDKNHVVRFYSLPFGGPRVSGLGFV
ncbi:unnamed protein product [Fraxinus pennsylvanica]|uniref:peroxidase n=1 Tax=Fraxinus pennsylvanica TaxID=56036 RepID=A0AAD2DSR4_9LAMI|nr:unnamed protein product [Fraxinus pennsylvanica]